MGTLARRVAQLEQQESGHQGDGVWGIRPVNYHTGSGPDVVTVPATGEQLTEVEFRRRYPRGILILRQEFRPAPTGDEAA